MSVDSAKVCALILDLKPIQDFFVRTTNSSVSLIKEKTWHFGSVRSEAFGLVKSEGKLALPAMCCRLTWYWLTVVKKDVTRGLVENTVKLAVSLL